MNLVTMGSLKSLKCRNQMESEFGGDRYFGILANMDFIMICTYEKDGENPELVIYKKR